MQFFFDSFKSAILLIVSLDSELVEVIAVSLNVSFFSTIIAALLGIPTGLHIAMRDFYLKRFVITCLNTLLALPTVVIALLVYTFISRKGLLGSLDLLYTQKAIIIGQIILIFPILTTYTISAVSRIEERYRKTAFTLGADMFQTVLVVMREARFALLAAVIIAFGRVIAEVGISMMLGGNAKGFTRTMTTAMALEYDKGEFVLSVALGIVLLLISFAVNVVLNYFQGKGRA
jgi:tungstate transport system permease protein